MITVTTSPLANVLLVNVSLFVPALLPLTCHWYDGVVPPFTGVAVNVTLAPRQIEVWLAITDTDGVTLLTVIVIPVEVAGDPVRHGMAFEVITTVTTSLLMRVVDVKVALFDPAFMPLTCHWYDGAAPPFVGVAVKVTDVPAQIAPDGDAATLTLAGRSGLTVIVIPVEVAGDPVRHGVAFEVIATVTTSLLMRVVDVKVALFDPAFMPLTCHWYDGADPPLTGVAVKVTDVPAQIAPDGDAATLTLAGRSGLTVIVMVFEVAGDPFRHGVAFDVISTVTISPLTSAVDVKVLLLVPAFVPFTFHWYVGDVPPFTGAAVNVTDVPAHMAPAGEAAIVTLAGRAGLTVNIKVAEVDWLHSG
jgi:uncharacterized protein YodC (DUF2158 family)